MQPSDERQVAGRSLYELVSEYAGFGNHWSGTEVDFATADWLVSILADMGAEPRREPWHFDRFAATTSLVCDGADVPVLPVWYSAVGDHEVTDFDTVQVPATIAGSPTGLNDFLDQGSKQAIVLAVDGPNDLPVQCNRVPTLATGRPAAIIPANWYDRVSSQDATLRFTGAINNGKSANILATFGSPDAPLVRLTTPLTGWTPAAGERGTGLAVALAMASDLADTYRVEFSACSGHEINHAGLHHHLAQRNLEGEIAIHLGASVAAVEAGPDGVLRLGAERGLLTSAPEPARSEIAQAAKAANFTPFDGGQSWPGEGGTWLEAGAAVLSFLGRSPLFHVADDVPDKATTPDALQTAASATIAAARIYLEDCFA